MLSKWFIHVSCFIIPEGASSDCDSIVYLDLTIDTRNANTSVNGSTISSNVAGLVISGIFAVEITENECIDTSACVAITLVSVIQNSFEDKVEVFPNPANGKFTIGFDKIQDQLTNWSRIKDVLSIITCKWEIQNLSYIVIFDIKDSKLGNPTFRFI